jgi:4-hydroxybenzoyl-CoA thioesterase
MLTNRRTIRIEWGDCDPAGIVYFPRYFEIFDICTSALMESAGFPKHKALEQFGVTGWPLVDLGAKFHASSRWGEDIEVESRVTEWGRSSFKIEHRITRGDTLCIEGYEKRMWVGKNPDDPIKIRSVPIPEPVLEKFKS